MNWRLMLPALAACAHVQLAGAQTARMLVRVENPLALPRASETVALGWQPLAQQLRALSPANVRVIDAFSGKEITTQVLDADVDGRPDSLLFQVTLGPEEVRAYTIEAAATRQPAAARAHVKFVPEREDVAWESDRIAFRIYGKKLWELENLHTNGIDVWPKRTRALVLDAWYAKGHDGYHIDTGEGADFYQVGTTLGTGGTGIWKDHALYRGDNFLAHRIIADGPVRALFELEYGAIEAAGAKAAERKRISIDAGQHFFRQESTFTAATAELAVAVGLVKRPQMVGSTSKQHDWAWLTGWGPIDPRTRGHGDLGNAVLVSKAQLADFHEIDDHYIAVGRIRSGETMVSYVGAGWTSSRDFEKAEDWWRHVDAYAQRLSVPVKVTVTSTRTPGGK